MKKLISPIIFSILYLTNGCGGSSDSKEQNSNPSIPTTPIEVSTIDIKRDQLIPFELLDSKEIGLGDEIPSLDDIYFETESSVKIPAITIDGKKIIVPDIGQNKNIKIKLVLEKDGKKISSKFISVQTNPYDFSVATEDNGKPIHAFLSAYLDNVKGSIALLDGIDPNDDFYQLLLAQQNYLENFIFAVESIQKGEEKVQVNSPYLDKKISFELKKEDLAVYDQLAIYQTMITEQIDIYFENKNKMAVAQPMLAAATSTVTPCQVNKFVIEKGKKIPYKDWIFRRNMHANASIDAVTNSVYAGLAAFSGLDKIGSYIKFLYPPAAALVTETQIVVTSLSLATQLAALTTKLAIAQKFNSDDGLDYEVNMVEISRLTTKIMTTNASKKIKDFLSEKIKVLLDNPASAPDIINSFDFMRRAVGDFTGLNTLIDNMILKFRTKLEGLVKQNMVISLEQQCNADITTIPYTSTYTRITESRIDESGINGCNGNIEKKTVSGIMTSFLENGETRYSLNTEEMTDFRPIRLTFSLPSFIPENTIHTYTYPNIGKPYDGTEIYITNSLEMGLNSGVYKHKISFKYKTIPLFCNISWVQTFKYTLPFTKKKN